MLHLDTIAPETLALLMRIQSLPEFAQTRLVGGTALALQFGHRVSVDLDLFGAWPQDANLFASLKQIGRVRKSSGSANGRLQFFFVDGVKVDCVAYDEYPWLEPPVEERGIRLAGVRDIAAMKVNAITNRGTRKDFVDLAFLLERFSMDEIFGWYCAKYPEASPALALRSLSYFVDAEADPLPRMLLPFDWDAAKAKVSAAVREMVGRPQNLPPSPW